MKHLICTLFCVLLSVAGYGQRQAEITFEADTISLGEFSEKEPVRTCSYVFTNTGDAPLIIHQAVATCGCTVPEFSKSAIAPGEQGEIKVTYNGRGKLTGPFTKTITVRSNAGKGIVRLYLKGDMTK